jgi:hypothetical protein
MKALLETAPRKAGFTSISSLAAGHLALRERNTGAVRMMSPSDDILITSMRGSAFFICAIEKKLYHLLIIRRKAAEAARAT